MSFQKRLLELIKDLGAITVDFAVSPAQLRRQFNAAHYYGTNYRAAKIYLALNRLEKQELIKKRKRGKYVKFYITDAGKRLLRKRSQLKKRHDRFSTVVIFDIPEEKHGARDAFRRYLQRNGFTTLQKSVMIGPYYLSKETLLLAEELKIKDCITLLSARIER